MDIFDAQMLSNILIASFAGAVIGLDRTAAGQFMFSEPIVAAPIIGWMLGDITSGLVIGAVLELIWLLDLPVGTFVPADSTIAAIFAVSSAVLGSQGEVKPHTLGFCILLSTVLAPVTMASEGFIRKINVRLADFAVPGAGNDAGAGLMRAHLLGLAVFFLKSFVLYIVFIPAGIAAVAWFSGPNDALHRGMAFFLKLLPMLGMALVARRLSLRIGDYFLLTGFAVALVLGLALHANFAVIAAAAACAGWLGVRFS